MPLPGYKVDARAGVIKKEVNTGVLYARIRYSGNSLSEYFQVESQAATHQSNRSSLENELYIVGKNSREKRTRPSAGQHDAGSMAGCPPRSPRSVLVQQSIPAHCGSSTQKNSALFITTTRTIQAADCISSTRVPSEASPDRWSLPPAVTYMVSAVLGSLVVHFPLIGVWNAGPFRSEVLPALTDYLSLSSHVWYRH